jgi:sortase A
MKALRIFTAFILIGGVCLTGRAAYLHAKAKLAGILIRRAWENTLRTGESSPPWPWADTYPIARLQIPRLGYDEMVLEGATPRTLAFGPARLLSGAGLGESGNLLLAGHRTSWFRPLEGIATGDTIQIQWLDSHRNLREMKYKVGVIRIVDPQDVTLLAPTSEEALTLITCYPFGSSPYSPQRFMVRAYPAGPSRPAETENANSSALAKK